MRCRMIAIAIGLMAATIANAQPSGRSESLARGVAVAEEVLAAERAFDRRAAEQGQWTTFRATATVDAVLFVPQRVNALEWLAGRSDPAASVRWQPHGVFVSCDGDTATTYGRAQWPDGSFGRFRTIWQRQTDGGWKWVLDTGWPTIDNRPAPNEPEILIANCEAPPPISSPRPERTGVFGSSDDRSLRWYIDVDADGRGGLSLHGWNGRSFQQLSFDRMEPPPAP